MKRVKSSAKAERSVDLVRLAETIEQFRGKKVVLYGDFVADEFQFGDISRVSREAPVLILKHRETRLVAGGGANATNNLAALGAKVVPVTVVGNDAAGEALMEYFRRLGVDTSGMAHVANWTTPTKTRFLAGWAHTTSQQVLRVDREPNRALPEKVHKQLAGKLFAGLRGADALAISDYGFGTATPGDARLAVRKVKKKIPVTLDARHGLMRYAGSGIVSATPNEAELEALHHTSIGKNVAELERCGHSTLATMKMNSLLVTRGRDGMALFERDGNRVTHIPVHGSDQAVDVTGAGDTVLAAYTLALASGASALEAAHIANIAGGLVVMKRGTATVSQAELLETIRRESSGS
ncbi:MAG TPA: PfkB family carbohydrate kinase [Candidatus Dormibacteraeota bacterium]|jgi:rfaE bifunctional protein kinase chain/domain|nr:PfkB family carbohydrate kinase [Candidatus Dormibacteraeota bacterium]